MDTESKVSNRIGYVDKVDFNKIVKEVATAMDSEEKYYRENDAKFRAVRQKVATYEEFCDIVLASNLNPLDKKDYHPISNIGLTPWNITAQTAKNNTSLPSFDQTNSNTSTSENMHLPSSCKEFNKSYKSFDSVLKYKYLLTIGGASLLRMFPVEMTDGIFDDVIITLDTELQPDHFSLAVDILLQMRNMNRFALSIKLLDDKAKISLHSLIAKLSQNAEFHTDLDSIKLTYLM